MMSGNRTMGTAGYPPAPTTPDEARAQFACERMTASVMTWRGCVGGYLRALSAAPSIHSGMVDPRRLCRGCPAGAARLEMLGPPDCVFRPKRRRSGLTENGQPDEEVLALRRAIDARLPPAHRHRRPRCAGKVVAR